MSRYETYREIVSLNHLVNGWFTICSSSFVSSFRPHIIINKLLQQLLALTMSDLSSIPPNHDQ
jgi:hypothetical protein